MAFKTTLLVCGLVLSIQNAYSQALGYGYGGAYANPFGSSYGASAASAASATSSANSASSANAASSASSTSATSATTKTKSVDVTVVDVDVVGHGAAYGNGIAAGNAGWGLGSAGLGYAGASLGAAGLAGAGYAGASSSAASAASLAATPVYLNLNSFSSGGVLPVTSIGSIVPVGITVVSDNTIEGAVALNGQLPFLTAVAFEGALASGGSGLAECGCGAAGNIGIISESVGPAAGASALGLGLAGLAAPSRLLY